MTETEKAYIAGLVDGEGCINIIYKKRVNGFTPHVSISNTNRGMLDWVLDKVKLGCIYTQLGSSKNKVCYRYELRVKEMESFLKAILPFLIAKKEQVILLLEYLGCRYERVAGLQKKPEELARQHRLIWEEINALNKRGPN